jgi:histidinol dehydrogenase
MKEAPGCIPVLRTEGAAMWAAESGRTPRDEGLQTAVRGIIEQVRAGGDGALLDLAEKLDGGRPATIRVAPERIRGALDRIGDERRKALMAARDNIERFHSAQRLKEDAVEVVPGVQAWREFRPIDRIGIYAPGGRAAYPSSVLMAAVPARLAGVKEIAVCAIAALALGTETVPAVDKIFGPGGAWVNAAKLALFDEVAIDLPAGPSEVTVWADSEANPDWVAAELLAQAEHGPDSLVAAVLSDDGARDSEVDRLAASLVKRAGARLDALAGLPRESAASSLARGAILIAPSDSTGARWVNDLAPEHLSIQRRDAGDVLDLVRHAGSVFVGGFAPVAAGDYCSGTNHVLPTGGRVRGASGLSVADFGRWMQVQRIDRDGLERLAPSIQTLAEWEGLPAHAASVRARFGDSAYDARGNDE